MVRFKHRYLLVHLLFPGAEADQFNFSQQRQNYATGTASEPVQIHFSESTIITLLRDSLSVNFGDVGAGEVGGTFSIKYLSPHTRTLIIRVSREHYRTLWAALTLLRRLGGHQVIARVLHVGGTIRKTQHAAIAHDRKVILELAKRNIMAAQSQSTEAIPIEATVQEQLKKSEQDLMAMEA